MAEEPAAIDVAVLDLAVLDLRGLKCPLPALYTRRALARLPAGAVLQVKTSDPMAAIDIPHVLAEGGDILQGCAQHGWGLAFTIAKGGFTPAGRPGPE